MVLSNAERQRRWRERRNALAKEAEIARAKRSPDKLVRVDIEFSDEEESELRRLETWCKPHNLSVSEGIRRIVLDRIESDKKAASAKRQEGKAKRGTAKAGARAK